MLLAGAEARAWQTPQGLCERRRWRRDSAQGVYAAGPFPPCSNTGSGEQRCCRWWSEDGPTHLYPGRLLKTVYAWQPEVSAVNRTAGLDSETVWWITQFYYSQDANILNGSAWFGDGWSQWFYTYADDSTWWPDAFTDYNTRTGTQGSLRSTPSIPTPSRHTTGCGIPPLAAGETSGHRMVPVGRSIVGSRRASGHSRPRRVRASDQGIAFAIISATTKTSRSSCPQMHASSSTPPYAGRSNPPPDTPGDRAGAATASSERNSGSGA